jgi:hypothetical protein
MSSNFRTLYRLSDEYARIEIAALFVLYAGALIATIFLTPVQVALLLFLVLVLVLAFFRPSWLLGFTLVYLPFHAFLLKWLPLELAPVSDYIPELLIAFLIMGVIWKWVSGKRHELVLTKRWFARMATALTVVVIVQVLLSYGQFAIGELLGVFLLPADGILAIVDSASFWDPGTRVFGTFGHFEQLAFFFVFFILFATALLCEPSIKREVGRNLWTLLLILLPAFALTYSVPAWVSACVACLFITLVAHHGWLARKRVELRILGRGAAAVFVTSIIGFLLGVDFAHGSLVTLIFLILIVTVFQVQLDRRKV